jgi:A/G-specific adenine glycosylase
LNIEIERLSAMIPPLCIWYEANQKLLPWREDRSPYHVWLSEIMLQQTRIEAVIPYYQRFLAELPTVEALASVSDERLMKLWQGLGYYSRARNLKIAAIRIVEDHNGILPDSAEALRKLPGIGDYTAGAIASIAYHKPEPAVDGNVLRVVMRLMACDDDIMLPATKRTVATALRAVYPDGRNASLLTEGLMELGETVCIPNGEPHCDHCPVRDFCKGYESGYPSAYPTRIVKTKRRIEKRTALLLRFGDRYAIVKRPSTGLLASMWEYPNHEGMMTAEEVIEHLSSQGIKVKAITPCGDAKHIFSHVEWHMTGYAVECETMSADYRYVPPAEMAEEYAIPTAFRAYTDKILL